jgi:hypothetical protein
VAALINIGHQDLPADWTIDRSPDGPLSWVTGPRASGGSAPAANPLYRQVASQFEQCMQLNAAQDRLFGQAVATPGADRTSPSFSGPGNPPAEAVSEVGVYKSSSVVTAEEAQSSTPAFPGCFGAAIGLLLSSGAQSGLPNGTLLGTPSVVPMAGLPLKSGVQVVGVDVVLPLHGPASSVPLQFGVVLVSGGRAEATLYTFSLQSSFPAAVNSSLVAILEAKVASLGTGTGV